MTYPVGGDTDAYGHRLVFANCSQFYADLFARFPSSESCYSCPIPLKEPNRFTELVDFFYENRITCSTENLALLGELLVTSAFYGVSSLQSILSECVSDILSNTKESRLGHVLEKPQDVLLMTKPFAKFSVQEIPELKELIDEGKKRIKETEEIFQEFVSQHVQTFVDTFNDDGMGRLDYLSPQLMLSVFKGMEVENKGKESKTKAKFIERYVENTGRNVSEMVIFNEAIDWSEPGIEKLFVKHKMTWVDPKKCRELLWTLFQKRRAMTQEVERLEKTEYQNWPMIYRLNEIANLQKDKNVDIVGFISTFGGLCRPFNVMKYDFVTIGGTAPVGGVNIFDATRLLDFENPGYYVSDPNKNKVNLWVNLPVGVSIEKVILSDIERPHRMMIDKQQLTVKIWTDVTQRSPLPIGEADEYIGSKDTRNGDQSRVIFTFPHDQTCNRITISKTCDHDFVRIGAITIEGRFVFVN